MLRKYIEGYISDELSDEQMEECIAGASICVLLANLRADMPRYHSKPANKRISKVQKAFEELTEEDRRFLDLHIELVREMKFGTSDACVDMAYALKQRVARADKSLSRSNMCDYAVSALKNEWFEEDSDLVNVLKILMEEAEVSHDAHAIVRDAKNRL